jgi:uncharacterized Zn-finger protein
MSSTDAPETVIVTQNRVSCEGVGGTLGHPKVYMQIGEQGWGECPYCDRRFVLESVAHGERAAQKSPNTEPLDADPNARNIARSAH